MKTINYFIKLLLLTVILTNCTEETKNFSIHGYVDNVKDSTVVYLMDLNSIPVDSTLIINKKFVFKGTVNEPSIFFVFIKETMDFKSFWVENRVINFIGESKNFNSAKVVGSKTQNIQNTLDKKLIPLRKKLVSINQIYGQRVSQYPDSIFNDSIQYKFFKGQSEINNRVKLFIRENPNNLVSIKKLNDLKTHFKKQNTSELFNLFSDEFKSTSYGQSVREYIYTSQNLRLGDKYVDFQQMNSKGELIQFSNYLGETYTLIEFWASWCGPCRRSNPNLVKAYQKYHSQGFEVIGVSLDTNKDKWLKAIEKDQLPWQNVSDLKGYQNEVALTYDIASLPNSFLLNKNGVIIAIGLRDGLLKKKLESLFKK